MKKAGPQPRYLKGKRVYNLGSYRTGYEYKGTPVVVDRFWIAPSSVRAERRSIYARKGWVPTFCR